MLIRKSVAIAGILVIIYLLVISTRGNRINEYIQGTWRSAECSTELSFVGSYYSIDGIEMGVFNFRRSIITLSCGSSYSIVIFRRQLYIIINGTVYLLVEI